MKLRVLSVAYPFAPVGPDAVGGAEQVLALLDTALAAAGHRSIVVACEGSQVAGELVATPPPAGRVDEAARRRAWAGHRRAIEDVIAREPVDVVHLHGIDFSEYLPAPGRGALLGTLHLPPSWYPSPLFEGRRADLWLQCVSHAQRRACPPGARMLGVIENGVPVDALACRVRKRRFALALGRVCPEKNLHAALDAGHFARTPVLVGGEVFPYEAHERYFREMLVPRLDRHRRFLGPLTFGRKRRLLAAARCLLLPTLAAETSSLVAMEALACGTPVVAYPNGALAEIVEHGVTGFLVRGPQEMADAIEAAGQLDPEACRAAGRARFGLERMVRRYFETYEQLALGACAPA